MGKIIEFEKVYLEYPDELELSDEQKEIDENEELILIESRTARFSLEELQKRLEETQALHL